MARRSSSFSRPGASLLAIAVVLLASRAFADPVSDAQLAQRLFEEARERLARGEIARACELFAESQRLDPGGGTQLNLALCHEQEGKLGTAYFELEEALSRAVKDRREDREEIARTHLAALALRAPRLQIVGMPDAVPAVLIELDGVPFRAPASNLTIRADPGRHALRASAMGRLPWTWTAVVREGDEIIIEIPKLEEPPKASTSTSFSTPSWVLGGVAVASLGMSAVSGVLALHNQSVYRDTCSEARRYCPDDEGPKAASAARSWAWVSTGTLALGVAAGVTAFLLPRTVSAAPIVGRDRVGAEVALTF